MSWRWQRSSRSMGTPGAPRTGCIPRGGSGRGSLSLHLCVKYIGIGAWRQGGRVHMQTREVAKPALGQVQRDLDDNCTTPHGRWYVRTHCVLRVCVSGGRFHFTHQKGGSGEPIHLPDLGVGLVFLALEATLPKWLRAQDVSSGLRQDTVCPSVQFMGERKYSGRCIVQCVTYEAPRSPSEPPALPLAWLCSPSAVVLGPSTPGLITRPRSCALLTGVSLSGHSAACSSVHLGLGACFVSPSGLSTLCHSRAGLCVAVCFRFSW